MVAEPQSLQNFWFFSGECLVWSFTTCPFWQICAISYSSILNLLLSNCLLCREDQTPNGLRYPLVGGTRQHRFDGTSLKPSLNHFGGTYPPVGCTLCWAAFESNATLQLKAITDIHLINIVLAFEILIVGEFCNNYTLENVDAVDIASLYF